MVVAVVEGDADVSALGAIGDQGDLLFAHRLRSGLQRRVIWDKTSQTVLDRDVVSQGEMG